MDVPGLLRDFARRCHVCTDLFPDAAVEVEVDDGVKLWLEHDREANLLHLYALLGPEPADEALSQLVCRQMLCWNAFGQHAQGAVLSIEEACEELMLCRWFALDREVVDAETLHHAALAMAQAARQWSAMLARMHDLPDPAPSFEGAAWTGAPQSEWSSFA